MNGPLDGLLRRLARLLIRGPDASYVLADLDDGVERDVARGLSPWRVRSRYAVNAVASAASVWAERLRPSAYRPSWVDVKLGLRMLVKYPALTAVALFALAIGIPVGLAPVHFADAIEANLPEDPDGRIRSLCYFGERHQQPTYDDLTLWQRSLTSFDAVAASRMTAFNVDLDGVVATAAGAEVTATTFEVLGTPPRLGRTFGPDDEVIGAPEVAVIGHDLWRRLGADPGIVGRPLELSGVTHTVVGVMPEGFLFPRSQQVWVPLREQPGVEPREGAPLSVFGRLADGVSADEAQREIDVLTAALALERPQTYDRLRPAVMPTWHLTFGFPTRAGLRGLPEFYLVQIGTLLPLLVACINVGLLIFARTATRSSEFAVRTALGASRARIITQVFTESFVIAVLATGAGLLLLALMPERALRIIGLGVMPYWMDMDLTVSTALRGLILAVGCAAIAGVVPALRVTGRSIRANLQRAGARRSGVRFGGLSSALIVIDVAVAMVVVGFAVAVTSRIQATWLNADADGIRAEQFLAVMVLDSQVPATAAPLDTAPGSPRLAATHDALVERLRSDPAVRAVAVATALPRMDHQIRRVEAEGVTSAAGARRHNVRSVHVAADFFAQLDHPIRAGRAFDARDMTPGSRAVIVNTSLVANLLGGRNPLGQRLRYLPFGEGEPGPWHEIVGVVGPLGTHSLSPGQDDGVYHPLRPGTANPVRLAVHVTGDPVAFAPRVREIAAEAAPQAVVASMEPLNRVFEGDWYIMAAVVVGGLVLVGILLALAASALYAIMSFTVAQRTREIGIRVALGADRRRIALHVARRALVQVALGVLLGMPLAGRIFFEIAEDAGASTPALLGFTLSLLPGIGVMVLVGGVACAAPTLRALRINPVEALRDG